MTHFRRLFCTPIRWITLRSTGSVTSEPNIQRPHIYKKTYTKDELLDYLKRNVVYESSDCVVTSVPQGINYFSNDKWITDKEPVCDICLQDMLDDMCKAFNSEKIFITRHPRRNASGLLVLSKNHAYSKSLSNHFKNCINDCKRIYTYVAVVTGCPNNLHLDKFWVDQVNDGCQLFTHIFENENVRTDKSKKGSYRHQVVDKTAHVSLLKINVSHDLRDCIKCILAQKCFTPVFGDSWNAKRTVNFLFGAPIACNPADVKEGTYELSPEILEKLQLTADDLKCIPIHSHLYSMRLSLKNKTEFFVSTPPPESFIWTCRQLGLEGIEMFTVHPKS